MTRDFEERLEQSPESVILACREHCILQVRQLGEEQKLSSALGGLSS